MSDQTKPWLETRLPVSASLNKTVWDAPMARDLPYLNTLGALITGTLIFLAISGFVLAVYYNPAHAFDSVQFIIRNVNYGWLIHSFHTSGTTMIFAAIYLAIFRAILIRSYQAPGEITWFLKLKILLALLLIGYLGAAMAGGTASYWSLQSATTAGARLSGLPGAVAAWFFGGPAGDGTLARLTILHIVLTLAVFGLLALHLAAKRAIALTPARPVKFHPYYTSQYFVAFVVFALIFAVLVFFAPHLGENPLNAMPASPLAVPAAAAPPWYLAPEAALASALPGPEGIIAFIAAFAVLYALPWLDRSKPGAPRSFLHRFIVFILALDVIGLSLAASAPPSTATAILGTIFTAWYFLHFLVLTPLVTAMEV